MDLRVREISFSQFRNYESFTLRDIGSLTVFVGPNAIGKSNLIEGIQLVTAHTSFRNPTGKELVMFGQDFARLEARIVSDARDLQVATVIQPGSRTHYLNGKKKTTQEMQGILPSIAFAPDDLMLVKGPQSQRRTALDLLGCQLSKNHRIIKRDYDKIVQHKNALLKDEAAPLLVESINDMLVPAASQLYRYRLALFKNLLGRIQEVYTGITQGEEHVQGSYVPSWETDDTKDLAQEIPLEFPYDDGEIAPLVQHALEERAPQERIRQRCLVGPHADRMEFFIDGRNVSSFASQGQQRSLVLAWKIAEIGLVRELVGVKPVLLLDDVMSELDAARRAALIDVLHDDIQTFISTTDLSYFSSDIMERARVFDLGTWRNEQ